jgi:NADH:ubiquinone oxidoreductase subunit C
VDLLAYQSTPSAANFKLLDVFYFYNRALYCVVFRSGCRRPLTEQSLDRFFFNYWWSERESSEHFGIFFSEKLDSRNLLLDYTWSLNPFLKLFPSAGFVEVFFDSLGGRLFHQKISYQI